MNFFDSMMCSCETTEKTNITCVPWLFLLLSWTCLNKAVKNITVNGTNVWMTSLLQIEVVNNVANLMFERAPVNLTKILNFTWLQREDFDLIQELGSGRLYTSEAEIIVVIWAFSCFLRSYVTKKNDRFYIKVPFFFFFQWFLCWEQLSITCMAAG